MMDVVLFAAILTLSGLSTAYLWRLYLSDESPRSWVLWTIAIAATVSFVAGAWVGVLLYFRLNEIDLPTWGRIVTAIIWITLILMPVAYATQMERRRRAYGRRMKALRDEEDQLVDGAVDLTDDEVGSPL